MTLADVLRRVPPALFAVIDGAFYDDLPTGLAASGFSATALYRGDAEMSGPHLVALDDGEAVPELLSVLGEPAPAVFWSWADGETSLHHHLRRIGMIELPRDGTNPADPDYMPTTFRHADPRAMAAVLPVLEPAQYAELLGEAAGIVFSYRDRLGQDRIVRAAGDGRIVSDPA